MEEAKRRMAETGKAISGRTARPCDGCGRDRAQWYCAADEAYLCDPCDTKVHNANAVARRHERVKFVSNQLQQPLIDFLSSGASKRRRSTRPHPQLKSKVKAELEFPSAPVPEHILGLGDSDDLDDELLPHVPIFLPALAEEFGPLGVRTSDVHESMKFNEFSSVLSKESNCEPVVVPESDLHQFLESETDLFAIDMDMDMESIIGQGLGEDGLVVLRDFDDFARDVKVEETGSDDLEVSKDDTKVVKLEEAEADQSWDTIEINIEYDDDEQDAATRIRTPDMEERDKFKIELHLGSSLGEDDKRISLKLNYEDVLSAWSDRGSLWASYDDCTSVLGGCHNNFEAGLVPDMGLNGAHVGPMPGMINCGGDQESCRQGAREARVLRYREKRLTRLFSKKIRYEVRKLNAEKRPRMK
ncbi:hypothetical protein KI387_022147, partial [Taxus chinensis]